ncbi:uncharacterized protein LOC119080354 [Bradysia coprophila]|uniref:uncharacterized protein LOC119080354 n=1 Tax=Bradysia coprophila TaxID=38358 RepID=UPI00187D92E1|nr:uncharacterized protein LOC119080354 [Bradysia coprophila]XP_037044549.1 uncharacterized protein LOC119080354 [Bradysia coprophila]
MKRICAAIVLGFFLGVWGCGPSTPSGPSCDFPHKGNGGILDQNGNYTKDAHFAWIDVAKNCFAFVTDPKGSDALNTWINASHIFNEAMKRDDEEEAFNQFYICNDAFKDVAPFISKCELSSYFRRVHREFGTILDTKNISIIHQYMVDAFPQFKEKLGC